jgi:hypothetical protein
LGIGSWAVKSEEEVTFSDATFSIMPESAAAHRHQETRCSSVDGLQIAHRKQQCALHAIFRAVVVKTATFSGRGEIPHRR